MDEELSPGVGIALTGEIVGSAWESGQERAAICALLGKRAGKRGIPMQDGQRDGCGRSREEDDQEEMVTTQ